MKQIGEGGNSVVVTDGTRAYKRLKHDISGEPGARFRREAELLIELRELPGLRVVPAHDIHEVDGRLEIVMDLFTGSLEQVLDRFKGQPQKAAGALEPIARTLAALAARERAVHHRDIKPTNLLYRASEDDLWLADFGCAFIAGDERLTPDRRAMGAWAYRPPEYSNGPVEDVDEKGDVFGLGKVLWAMIYGEKGVVFPSVIWFTPDVDLGRLFPNAPGVHHAMLVISQACAIDPQSRPTLDQLAQSLANLTDVQAVKIGNDRAQLRRGQALVEVEHAQQSAATAVFVRALHRDLHDAIADLHNSEPDFRFWAEWQREALGTGQTVERLVSQVAEHSSDAMAVVVQSRSRFFTARFYPATAMRPSRLHVSVGLDDFINSRADLDIVNAPSGVEFQTLNAEPLPATGRYTATLLRQFLELGTQRIYPASAKGS